MAFVQHQEFIYFCLFSSLPPLFILSLPLPLLFFLALYDSSRFPVPLFVFADVDFIVSVSSLYRFALFLLSLILLYFFLSPVLPFFSFECSKQPATSNQQRNTNNENKEETVWKCWHLLKTVYRPFRNKKSKYEMKQMKNNESDMNIWKYKCKWYDEE